MTSSPTCSATPLWSRTAERRGVRQEMDILTPQPERLPDPQPRHPHQHDQEPVAGVARQLDHHRDLLRREALDTWIVRLEPQRPHLHVPQPPRLTHTPGGGNEPKVLRLRKRGNHLLTDPAHRPGEPEELRQRGQHRVRAPVLPEPRPRRRTLAPRRQRLTDQPVPKPQQILKPGSGPIEAALAAPGQVQRHPARVDPLGVHRTPPPTQTLQVRTRLVMQPVELIDDDPGHRGSGPRRNDPLHSELHT